VNLNPNGKASFDQEGGGWRSRTGAQLKPAGKVRAGKEEELLEFSAGARTAFDDKVDGNATHNRYLSLVTHHSSQPLY
jgi:hypothetical protein